MFGNIVSGEMILNEFGSIVDEKINELKKYRNVDINVYCVMPNHVHFIIQIVVGADPCVRPLSNPRVRPLSNPRACPSSNIYTNPSSNARTHPHKQNTLELTRNISELTRDSPGLTRDGPGSTRGSTPTTVGEYVKRLKTLTTRIYIENVNNNNWPLFNKRLWQRNYYERIIKNENEYTKIKTYIQTNPSVWERKF